MLTVLRGSGIQRRANILCVERSTYAISSDDLESVTHRDKNYDEKLRVELDALRKQLAQKQWNAGQIQQELHTMAIVKAELPQKMEILKVVAV